MQPFQQQFIELALSANVLRFGEFKLKSGRLSPYFFNAGLFNTGGKVAALGRHYASAIVNSGLRFDMLFGPAYKGIPLVTTTAIALAEQHGLDLPYAFNRKEAKTYGEGGTLIGAPLAGRVLIIDDVITAGLAIRDSVEIIRAAGAEPAGVMIAMDRQERGLGTASAVQEVRDAFGIPVLSIISLAVLLSYLELDGKAEILEKVRNYKAQYGV